MTKLISAVIALFCAGSLCVPAQGRRSKKTPKPPVLATPAPSATPRPQPKATPPAKRNGRPDGASGNGNTARVYIPAYFYEYSRPGFTFSRILIEHDVQGRGKVSFQRDGSDELFTDPLELTPVTLDHINSALAKLDFLNSSEVYQTQRDYSNMGNVTFTYKDSGRERTVRYNWSDNADAKALMDEYRYIGNEYTWKFEIAVARENQPLQTPGLLDQMDSYIERKEISDPPHLITFLTDLSNDERLPLIARNHAAKLVRRIEKANK
jgi:hypothetical protein